MRAPSLTFRLIALLGVAAAWVAPAHAQWTDIATISSTLGNNASRLCVGGGKTDLGCPVSAPYLDMATGNLSIGTTSPTTYKLNVAGGASYLQGGVLVGNVANGVNSARITSGLDSATYISFHWGQPDMTFYTNNARRMTIASGNLGAEYAGRVGIGNMTYPSATLHVSGTIRMASGGEACDVNRTGAIRYQGGMFQICQSPAIGWEALATTGENSAVDRITSSSMAGVTANATGYISLTTGGVTGTAYFTPASVLVNAGVSATNTVSASGGYFGSMRIGQTGAFTNAISPFQSYADIVGNYTGIGGVEMRNQSNGPNAEFRFMVSDERGGAGTQLAFTMPSSNNTSNLFGIPRNLLATIFVNATNDAQSRALAIGTLKSNPVIFAANNAERMRIAPNGNVGIGTTTPSSTLHVIGDIRGSNDIYMPYGNSLRAGSFNYTTVLQTGWNGWADYTALFTPGNDASNALPRMVLLSNGNVGIGTTTPTTALQISGTLRVAYDNATCDADHLGAIKYQSGQFQICRNGSTWEYLVAGTNATVDTDRITSGTASVITSGASNTIQLRTFSTPRMTVTSNGFVGIGETLPSGFLHISGASLGTAVNDVVRLQRLQTLNNSLSRLDFLSLRHTAGNSASEASSRIQQMTDATYQGYMEFNGLNNTNGLAFGTGSALSNYAGVPERMRITADGNVGIGSSSPTTKLDVAGTLKVAAGGEACDANRTGAIKYQSGQFQICRNGTSWETLIAGNSGTVDADRITSGTTSMITYNNDKATIATAGVERVVVGATGSVGIAQQPAVGVALAVSGNTSVSGRLGVITPGTNNVFVGNFAGANATGTENTGFGQGALQGVSGQNNTAVGRYTAQNNSGNDSSFFGSGSGLTNAGNSVTGVGLNSLQNNSASYVVGVGTNAGQSNRATGTNSVFVGNDSGQFNSGASTAAIGAAAAQRNSGDNLSAIGVNAGQWNSGANVVAAGFNAAQFNAGNYVTAVGQLAANKNTADQVTALGYNAVSAVSNTFSNITGLGYDAQPTKSNQIMLGNTLIDEVFSYGAGVFGKYIRPGGQTTALMTSATLAGAGAIMYDTTLNSLRYSDGTQWNTLVGQTGSSAMNADRIISGTTAVVANTNANTVSVTTGGTTTSYFHSTIGLVAPGVSATGTVSSGNVNTGLVVLRGVAGGAGISLTAPGDNLGNHTATQDLDMAGNNIINANTISATSFTGDGSGLTNINAANITGLTADRITSGTTQVIANQNTSLTLATAGVERMVIGTDGRVGIGQQPATGRALSVSGSVAVATGYGALNSGLAIGGLGDSPNMGSIAWGDNSGWKLNFGTGIAGVFTPRVTFMDTGNVGIGTTNPTSNLHLSGSNTFIVGMIENTNNVGAAELGLKRGNVGWWWSNRQTGLELVNTQDGGTTYQIPIAFANNGNVGIGTSNFSAMAQLVVSTTTNQFSDGIISYANDKSNGESQFTALGTTGSLRLAAQSHPGSFNPLVQQDDARITFNGGLNTGGLVIAPWTPSTNGLRMDNFGKIGLGKVTPTTTLDIAGSVRLAAETSSTLNICDANRTGAIKFESNQFQICRNPVSGWETLIAGAGGSVATDRITSGTTGMYTYNNTSATIATAGVERVIVGSNGRVGIGQQPGTEALSVSSTLRVGDVIVGNENATSNRMEIGYNISTNKSAYIDLIGDTTYSDYGLRLWRTGGGANADSYLMHRGTGTLHFTAEEAAPMLFKTTNTERLRITPAGLVGIGTSAPSNNLEVLSNIQVATDPSASSQAQIKFVTQAASGLTGNVGVGATKGWTMYARNSIYGTAHEQNDLGFAYYDGSTWKTPLFIDSQLGYIGMGGISSPTVQLDISGTVAGNMLVLKNVSGSAGISLTSAGDNLGNHTATQNLDMAGFSIVNASNITATGSVQAGNADTVCSSTADYGKMRFNPATKKMFMCRP
ncbi:MAG: hypothetical protein DI628_07935 [Blastochloris viridis]|uniref:Uncharacterized protein n=1 Tax=Blastochloris viridis TaxID=1079 RepID=A0A6N4RCK7_BLAVI|nr:MAG: hypothetical protein DI628_07935 [Blastochloris viridis]